MKYPHILFLVTALSLPAVAQSQSTLTAAANMPRDGDSLMVDILGDMPQSPARGVCDLSGISAKKRTASVYAIQKDTIKANTLGTETRLILRGDTLAIAGYENRRILVEYDSPLPLLRWPMSPGDSLGGYFQGNAAWCNALFARIRGKAWSVADLLDKVIVSSGDTIKNVVRIKHIRETCHITYDNIHTWDELLLSANAEKSSPPTSQLPIRTETTALFAPGYRYPILVMESTKDGTLQHSSSIACAPSCQMELAYDMENALRRDSMELYGSHSSRRQAGQPHVTVKSLQFDGSSGKLSITCQASAETDVRFVVSDAAGILWREGTGKVQSRCPSQFEMDCSGLRKGQYALQVTCGQERQSFKFNIK